MRHNARMTEPARYSVLIVGGGFGGLRAAQCLKRAPIDVTLIDRRNFHLFQPLLYQVATGGLSPANIAAPLRAVLKRQPNVRVLLGEVVAFDINGRGALLRDGEAIPYDTLIVAAGAANHYFGNDRWAEYAPGLKSLEDATHIRRRLLLAFEAAEREKDPQRVPEWLTFVIVGGGPTGVELAGTLAEIARYTLRHEFRRIDPAATRILLVEGAERVLPTFVPRLSEKAERSLRRLGVDVRTRTLVTDIQSDSVTLRSGDGEEVVATRTAVWGAGVQASSLGRTLAVATGAELDRAGRVIVQPDCSLRDHPEIFVIGDLAHFRGPDGKPLPGVAPVAIQQGEYVARLIRERARQARGPNPPPAAADDRGRARPQRPFRYVDRGIMATIGRAAAVADLHWVRFWGYPAWLVWLFIHLIMLVEFQNKLLVLVQWAWNYFTWSRSARLITGDEPGR